MYIKAIENATEQQRALLLKTFDDKNLPDEKKIGIVQQIYVQTQAEQFLLKDIEQYTQKALNYLEDAKISGENKMILKVFSQALMQRRK